MTTSEGQAVTTDRIERSIAIAATPERVWGIVSEPGWWINDGTIRPHRIDDAGDGLFIVHDEEHGAFRIRTEQLDPPRYAAFRWIGREDEKGAGTLTEFWLEASEDGVTLRVVESGLDNVPEDRREDYLRENSEGWEMELAAARDVAERQG
ncbi:MAG: SRPBCC domain-containing protein [Lapillicoccus sp.]